MGKLPIFLRGRGKMWSKLGGSHWSIQVKLYGQKLQGKHAQCDMTNMDDHAWAGKFPTVAMIIFMGQVPQRGLMSCSPPKVHVGCCYPRSKGGYPPWLGINGDHGILEPSMPSLETALQETSCRGSTASFRKASSMGCIKSEWKACDTFKALHQSENQVRPLSWVNDFDS